MQLRAGRSALLLGQWRQHFTPQRTLPSLVWRQGLGDPAGLIRRSGQDVIAGSPGGQPVAAVDLVLVIQVGQPLRELQAPAEVIAAQETRQRLVLGARQQAGQDLHQTPGERLFVQRRLARHRCATQNLTVGPPHESARQFDAGRSADPGLRGQGHLQPLRHAVALDQKNLLLQRLQRLAPDPLEHRLGQQFRTVAVQDQQAGLDVSRHGVEWSLLRAVSELESDG